MYSLRTICNTTGVEVNYDLGRDYSVTHFENSEEEFNRIFKMQYPAEEFNAETSRIYAFLIFDKGSNMIPLCKTKYNYICTENGNTYSNLTFK